MKKFIALAAVVLVSMATTTMYAQESSCLLYTSPSPRDTR